MSEYAGFKIVEDDCDPHFIDEAALHVQRMVAKKIKELGDEVE